MTVERKVSKSKRYAKVWSIQVDTYWISEWWWILKQHSMSLLSRTSMQRRRYATFTIEFSIYFNALCTHYIEYEWNENSFSFSFFFDNKQVNIASVWRVNNKERLVDSLSQTRHSVSQRRVQHEVEIQATESMLSVSCQTEKDFGLNDKVYALHSWENVSWRDDWDVVSDRHS